LIQKHLPKGETGIIAEQDEAWLIVKRLREWEGEYFRFIDTSRR
jgi:hypothetical protein